VKKLISKKMKFIAYTFQVSFLRPGRSPKDPHPASLIKTLRKPRQMMMMHAHSHDCAGELGLGHNTLTTDLGTRTVSLKLTDFTQSAQ
jgi:hypothetical protein